MKIKEKYDIIFDEQNNAYQVRTKNDVIIIEFSDSEKESVFKDILHLYEEQTFYTFLQLKTKLISKYSYEKILDVVRELQECQLLTDDNFETDIEEDKLNNITSFISNNQFGNLSEIKLGYIGDKELGRKIKDRAGEYGYEKFNMHQLNDKLGESEIRLIFENNDFIIIDSSIWNPCLMELINEIALELKRSWLLVEGLVDYAFFSIGPLFHGRETGCYECYKNRLRSNDEFLHYTQSYEAYLKKEKKSAKPDIVPKLVEFSENVKLYWEKCIDLTTGKNVYTPAACIYLPWTIEDEWITTGTSTGLAAHTNYYKAILTALYEIIERDSFVITWYQKIFSNKIIIDKHIQDYINQKFPAKYEWHFFDITYDIKIPVVFGICYGEAEFGKFVAVGAACRGTISEALRKIVLEIGQGVSYFRYLLGEKKNWFPDDDFSKILNFDEHSIFYIKRPDFQYVLDVWRQAEPTLQIDFFEKDEKGEKEQIKSIVQLLKNKNYNVLLRDLTTPDANQAGFHCIRVIVPQLLQMGGAYSFYFLGGKRLYEVPAIMGHRSRNYDELNKFPHPFP
jgi:ribosomal protein S12 methylthiotransferase accessory factor